MRLGKMKVPSYRFLPSSLVIFAHLKAKISALLTDTNLSADMFQSSWQPERIGKSNQISYLENLVARKQWEFNFLFEQVPMGMALISTQTAQVYAVNSNFARITERSAGELKESDLTRSFMHEDGATRLNLKQTTGGAEGIMRHPRIQCLLPRETVRWVEMQLAPFGTPEEAPILSLCSIQDITDRVLRENEQALIHHKVESLNQRLSLAVRGAGFGVWEFDLKTQRLSWDDRMFSIYGHSRETFDQSSEMWQACLHPDDREMVGHRFADLLEGRAVDLFDFRIYHASDKSLRYFEANGFLQRDNLGQPQILVGMNRDITQRKYDEDETNRAKKEAEEANRAKTLFLANMSHEIRTPLAAITGFSDLLATHATSTMDKSGWISAIHRANHHLESIVNDLLDLSRVESGNLLIKPSRVTIDSIVTHLQSLLEPRTLEKGLSLRFIADGKLPETITTDAQRLEQILLNIIGNAIKFTESGSVEVSVKFIPGATPGPSPQLSFAVTDTGIGIEKHQAELIFEAFTQADDSITRRFGGTGLGLTISKRLARLMGGDLELEFSEVEKGSRFVVTIDPGVIEPRFYEEGACRQDFEQLDASLTPNQRRLVGLKVLLVEDAPDLRMFLQFILESEGALVYAAENGLQALLVFEQSVFDSVYMDLQMPVMDGYAATQRMRSDGYEGPIFALTAHAMASERERCLKLGFTDFLAKPVNAELLVRTTLRYTSKLT